LLRGLAGEGQREGHLSAADLEIAHESQGDHVLAPIGILDRAEDLEDGGLRDRLAAHGVIIGGRPRTVKEKPGPDVVQALAQVEKSGET
jgi:hypothetical protein